MWYHDLGFNENPFDDNPEKKLIGYENVVDETIYNINAGNIVFIEGKNGHGKTSILKRVIREFAGFGKVAYVECEKIKELNIENVIRGRLGFFDKMMNKMPSSMIVLIDNVNEMSKKNSERLKYYYDQNYIKAVVLTGESYNKLNFSDSLRDRVKRVIKISELKDYEAVDILNSRLGEKRLIDDELAKDIFERVDKNPREFLKACEELCKNIAELKEEKVTTEHIDKVLPTRKHSVAKKVLEKQGKKPEKESSAKKKAGEEKAEELKVIYEQIDEAERYY